MRVIHNDVMRKMLKLKKALLSQNGVNGVMTVFDKVQNYYINLKNFNNYKIDNFFNKLKNISHVHQCSHLDGFK